LIENSDNAVLTRAGPAFSSAERDEIKKVAHLLSERPWLVDWRNEFDEL
jgi:hypothetical protein